MKNAFRSLPFNKKTLQISMLFLGQQQQLSTHRTHKSGFLLDVCVIGLRSEHSLGTSSRLQTDVTELVCAVELQHGLRHVLAAFRTERALTASTLMASRPLVGHFYNNDSEQGNNLFIAFCCFDLYFERF